MPLKVKMIGYEVAPQTTTGITQVTDCALYYNNGTDVRCFKCIFGKQLIMTYATGTLTYSCGTFSDCSTTAYYSGFSSFV